MSDRGAQIIEKAMELGATMAGIASIEALKKSPSHEILKTFGTEIDGVAVLPGMEDFREIKWPPKTDSALVIAVSHPQDKPELDWSHEKAGTPGNRTLVRINRELSEWIEETLDIKTHKMPYHVEMGGIYLKDAAVLAGLGRIGRNNILITKVLGPRVRLRGMLLEAELTPTGPIAFDPCDGCEEYCRKACPQNAFEERVHSSVEIGISFYYFLKMKNTAPRIITKTTNGMISWMIFNWAAEKMIMPYTVGRNLKTILDKSNTPTDHNHFP